MYIIAEGKIFSRTADWKKSKFTWNLECVSWTTDLCISFTVHVSISYCHIARSKTNKSNHLIHVFKTFGYVHFSLSSYACIYMYITFILTFNMVLYFRNRRKRNFGACTRHFGNLASHQVLTQYLFIKFIILMYLIGI